MSAGSVGASLHVNPVELRLSDRDEDDTLLRAIAAGDEPALCVLVGRHGPVALALASGLLRASSAEAVTTAAFADVWRGTAVYGPSKGSVRSWLLGLVHRRAVELAREQPSQRRHPDDLATPPPDSEAGHVETALGLLPPQQRQIVELIYFHGVTRTEVAERLGIAPSLVSARCCSAMRALHAEPVA